MGWISITSYDKHQKACNFELPIRQENENFMLIAHDKSAIDVEVQCFHLCHRKNQSSLQGVGIQFFKIKYQ